MDTEKYYCDSKSDWSAHALEHANASPPFKPGSLDATRLMDVRPAPENHSVEASGDTVASVGSMEDAIEAIFQTLFLATHRLRGWTSEPDLDRQLSHGALSLYGRFLLRGEDVSVSIWQNGFECWRECELAPDWHPLRAFVEDEWAKFQEYFNTFADADDTLVLVGRWVDFFGNAPGSLVVYVQHVVNADRIRSRPYTGGLAACDPSLGEAGFRFALAGKDLKTDKAALQQYTRRRVLAECRRLGYAGEPIIDGIWWWSRDLGSADYYSIVTTLRDEESLLDVS